MSSFFSKFKAKPQPNQYKGARTAIADLTEEEQFQIKEMLQDGMTPSDVAKEMKLQPDIIYRFKRYRVDGDRAKGKEDPEDSLADLKTNIAREKLESELAALKSQNERKKLKDDLEIEKLRLEIEQKRRDLNGEDDDSEEYEDTDPETELFGFLRELMDRAERNKQTAPQDPYVIISPNPDNKNIAGNTPTQGAASSQTTKRPPVKAQAGKIKLTDAEIKERLKEAPARYRKIARVMSDAELMRFLDKNAPEYDDDTKKRAVVILQRGV